MATNKTTLTLDQIHEAIDNADTGSALTDTTHSFTGGTLAPAIETVQAVQANALLPDVQDSGSTIFGAVRRTSVTGFLTNAVYDAVQGTDFIDYDPDLDHGSNARSLLREYGIPETSETMDSLLRGGTAEDQALIASRLAKHQFDLDVMERHGTIAFTTGVVDPAYVLADLATWGTTRALRMGRAVSALAGAGASTGVLAAADAAGKETTPFEYLTTAALSGGAYALFGGQAANNIASGKANWFGKMKNPLKATNDKANRFFSEADKVAPTVESQQVVKDLIDDPLRRDSFFNNDNAASVLRKLDNITEGARMELDTAIDNTLKDSYGFRSVLSRTLDLGKAYTRARTQLMDDVYQELIRRNEEFRVYGRVLNEGANPEINKIADVHQKMMNASGETAKAHGLPGFEEFLPQPGYVHRAWSGSKIRAAESKYGSEVVYGLLQRAIKQGIPGMVDEDAKVLARAFVDRAKVKEVGNTTDFMGVLGRVDTDAFIELLKAGGLDGAALESATQRLTSLLDAKTLPKYARSRLPLDMMAVYKHTDGSSLKMTDLVETDINRIARNYTATINGRSALSKAGIGKTDSEIGTWKNKYYASIKDLPKDQFDEAVKQMDGIIGDFTGNIPEANILGPTAQRFSSLANSTMLGAQGIWQATELATMAHYFGKVETAKMFFKSFPGVRQTLQAMNGKPDLADEVLAVTSIDLTRDIRWKAWMGQHTDFVNSSTTALDRVLHVGKQAMPYITAMKYVHDLEVRMAMNLAIQRFAKAMKGDAKAMAEVQSYGKDVDWGPVFSRNRGKVTWGGKNATEMNWGQWPEADVDTVMNTVLRYVDDTILYGRVGQGSGFGRSQTGQILGQFRSFVALAHNKQMRGTLQNQGTLAYAHLLACQYPLTVLMVSLNEARKGTLEIETEDDIKKLFKKSVGYTAGFGFYADAAGTLGLTGGRGGLGVPIVTALQAPARIIGGINKQFNDKTTDDAQGVGDIMQGAGMVLPTVMAIPGVAYYINSFKGD